VGLERLPRVFELRERRVRVDSRRRDVPVAGPVPHFVYRPARLEHPRNELAAPAPRFQRRDDQVVEVTFHAVRPPDRERGLQQALLLPRSRVQPAAAVDLLLRPRSDNSLAVPLEASRPLNRIHVTKR